MKRIKIAKAKKVLLGKEISYSGFCGEVERANIIDVIDYSEEFRKFTVTTNHKESFYREVVILECDVFKIGKFEKFRLKMLEHYLK